MPYDSIVITLILLVDSYSLYLLRKDVISKQRKYTSRRFNKLVKSLGL